MRQFSDEQSHQFIEAAGAGNAYLVTKLLDHLYGDDTTGRLLWHTPADETLSRGAFEAALNGHLEILKILHGYTGVYKQSFPQIIAAKQWKVLDWLMNADGEETFIRYKGASDGFLAPKLAMLLIGLSSPERKDLMRRLEGMFPEDFTAEFCAELQS